MKKNYVIEVLNKNHAKLVKSHFERMGIQIGTYSFNTTKSENGISRFYGVSLINSLQMYNYSPAELEEHSNTISILTLEEAMKLEPNYNYIDTTNKTFPRKMWVWDSGDNTKDAQRIVLYKHGNYCVAILEKYVYSYLIGEYFETETYNYGEDVSEEELIEDLTLDDLKTYYILNTNKKINLVLDER